MGARTTPSSKLWGSGPCRPSPGADSSVISGLGKPRLAPSNKANAGHQQMGLGRKTQYGFLLEPIGPPSCTAVGSHWPRFGIGPLAILAAGHGRGRGRAGRRIPRTSALLAGTGGQDPVSCATIPPAAWPDGIGIGTRIRIRIRIRITCQKHK